MRTPFCTRALLAMAAVLALAAFRAAPADRGAVFAAAPHAERAVAVAAGAAPAPPEQQRPQLAWPAPGAINSPFGGRRHHPGIDIAGATGDPVVAAAAGTVVLAGMAPAGYAGYGNVVLVDHGQGVATLYAHLSRVDVAMGQAVTQGQLLGAIGATGEATGPHLHFEVRDGGHPVDPVPWLPTRA